MALTQAQFDALIEFHAPALYRLAYRLIGDRHEAEDVVQETFRSAWGSRARYERGRGDRAWLVAILRRRVVDRWRSRFGASSAGNPRLAIVSSDALVDVRAPTEDPLANEYSDEVQRALNRLPDELRDTLLMVVVAEMTHQEVADELGIPLGTVLSRVSRARTRLREYLLAEKTMEP